MFKLILQWRSDYSVTCETLCVRPSLTIHSSIRLLSTPPPALIALPPPPHFHADPLLFPTPADLTVAWGEKCKNKKKGEVKHGVRWGQTAFDVHSGHQLRLKHNPLGL